MNDSAHARFFTPPYDFIDNGESELMLVCETVPEEPEAPLFYFDSRFKTQNRAVHRFFLY